MDCDNLNDLKMWYACDMWWDYLLLSDHKGVETSTGPEKD